MNHHKDFMIRSGICISLLLVLLTTASLRAQNLYDLNHSREFAAYLMRSGQYRMAASEWQRVLFMAPDDSLARLNYLISLRKSESYTQATDQLNAWFGATAPLAFQREGIRTSLISGNYNLAQQKIANSQQLPPDESDFYRLGLALLSWNGDKRTLSGFDTHYYPGYPALMTLREEAELISMRSPGAALALSALVPGLGKIYAHDWKDGILTMLFVGGNALQAYRGFSQSGITSVYGWIFGSLAAAFYTANLFGSYKSAKDYNQRQIERIRHEAAHLVYSRF